MGQECLVNPNLTQFIDDEGRVLQLRLLEPLFSKGGFATAKKTCQEVNWYFLDGHGALCLNGAIVPKKERKLYCELLNLSNC